MKKGYQNDSLFSFEINWHSVHLCPNYHLKRLSSFLLQIGILFGLGKQLLGTSTFRAIKSADRYAEKRTKGQGGAPASL